MHVAAVFSAFFVMALPLLIFASIWAIVTSLRICFPERPLPLFGEDPAAKALRMKLPQGEVVRVGVRQIRENHRREVLHHGEVDYTYDPILGYTDRFPDAWVEDLVLRRN